MFEVLLCVSDWGEKRNLYICVLLFQDILDEMRKELSKLKEELIDGNIFCVCVCVVMYAYSSSQ